MKRKHIRRLVVKVGTANLCNQSGNMSQRIFNDYANQIARLSLSGVEVVIVSSGAIIAGMEKMVKNGLNTHHFHKKDIAGIGARHLMNGWGKAFEAHGMEVGQVWVTYGNWINKGERKSIESSLLAYLNSMAIIPVVNEADVISDREIQLMEKGFSENDRLARMVASLVDADAVLFLTDKGGIFTKDPRKNHPARMYEEINMWSKPNLVGITNGTSKSGTGGMMAKWKEASECAKRGMMVAIAGNQTNVILRFVNGDSVGTRIGKHTKLYPV